MEADNWSLLAARRALASRRTSYMLRLQQCFIYLITE